MQVGLPIHPNQVGRPWPCLNHQPASSCWEGRGCWASHMSTASSGRDTSQLPPPASGNSSCSCPEKGKEVRTMCEADCAPPSPPSPAHYGGQELCRARSSEETGLQGAFPMWGHSQVLYISLRTLAPSLELLPGIRGSAHPHPLPMQT